jgi:hypothetical protein
MSYSLPMACSIRQAPLGGIDQGVASFICMEFTSQEEAGLFSVTRCIEFCCLAPVFHDPGFSENRLLLAATEGAWFGQGDIFAGLARVAEL